MEFGIFGGIESNLGWIVPNIKGWVSRGKAKKISKGQITIIYLDKEY